MNQPTREEFDDLKEEHRQLQEEMRQLREQITEPIKITRLEIDSGSMHKRLDAVQEDTNILKVQMEGARADILQIRESQADLRDRLIEHSEDLGAIKEKQDTHSELFGQLITIGEETKSDIAELKTSQAEQGQKLDLILKLLQKGE